MDWLILRYLGVFQIALAYFLMTRAMRCVPAFEASLLLLLEPVLNPIWTWLVYRERPGNLALAWRRADHRRNSRTDLVEFSVRQRHPHQ